MLTGQRPTCQTSRRLQRNPTQACGVLFGDETDDECRDPLGSFARGSWRVGTVSNCFIKLSYARRWLMRSAKLFNDSFSHSPGTTTCLPNAPDYPDPCELPFTVQ
jgi:hypothetical protein